MAKKTLFRKNIEPRCAYCTRSSKLDDRFCACRFFGVVALGYHCHFFKYDPLKRIPPKPAVLRGTFCDLDFLLDEPEETEAAKP